MPNKMSLTKGIFALIGVHLLGVVLVLGFILGVSWLITRLTGLVWSETAVLFLACLIWAVMLQKIFEAGFGGMLMLLAIGSLLAFGGGWLLSQWLSTSFLQAGWLPLGAAFAFMYYFFADLKEIREEMEEEGWLDEEELPIPRIRFMRDDSEQTGEALFRYIIANAICRRMNETPSVKGSLDSTEVQELSIRLADAAVFVLRRKSPRTQRFQLTVPVLRKAFNQMGQQPYDDDILQLAVVAVNTQLMLDEDLEDIVRSRRWTTHFMR